MQDPIIEVKMVYSNIFKFTNARKTWALGRVGYDSNNI